MAANAMRKFEVFISKRHRIDMYEYSYMYLKYSAIKSWIKAVESRPAVFKAFLVIEPLFTVALVLRRSLLKSSHNTLKLLKGAGELLRGQLPSDKRLVSPVDISIFFSRCFS